MPEVAAFVDAARQAFGRAVVDAAIASGQRLRREHDRIAAQHGPQQAQAWLARQAPREGCFWAEENGRTVGIRRS